MTEPHRITVFIDDGEIGFVSPQALGVYAESAEYIRAPSPELLERLRGHSEALERMYHLHLETSGSPPYELTELVRIARDLLEHYEGKDDA